MIGVQMLVTGLLGIPPVNGLIPQARWSEMARDGPRWPEMAQLGISQNRVGRRWCCY